MSPSSNQSKSHRSNESKKRHGGSYRLIYIITYKQHKISYTIHPITKTLTFSNKSV